MTHGIALYTYPGTPLHSELCEAFLALRGYILIEMDMLYEVVSMGPAADRERTLWRLVAASHAGAS